MLFVTENKNQFKISRSLDEQLKFLSELRSTHPEEAQRIFEKGEQLIQYSSRGEFRKLRQLVESYEEGELMTFFISKMLLASLVNGYLMISSYIIDNGYPHTRTDLPSLLHESLEVVDDSRGADIVEFLVMKKADVNRQLPVSWITPLHISVRLSSPLLSRNTGIRRLLYRTTLALLDAGADINAVAKNDVMPLNVAQDLETTSDKDAIVKLLLERGARDTWRRDGGTSFFPTSTGVPRMETKFVSFSGGSAILAPSSVVSPSSTNGYVSMKGMVFSTTTQNHESSQPPSSSTPSTSKSVSADESQQRKPRRQFQAVSSSVISVNNSEPNLLPSTSLPSSEASSVVIEESSDGGLMFSTGS